MTDDGSAPQALSKLEVGREDDWFADLVDRPEPLGLINTIRYDHAHKRWHVWDGIRWKADATRGVFELLRTKLETYWLPATDSDAVLKNLRTLKNVTKKESVLTAVASRPAFAMRGDEWDPHGHIIGCANGLVRLTDGAFLGGDHPEFLVTKAVRARWDPQAECPRFLKFLDEIMGGDLDKQRYLLRVLGYAMFGGQAEQKFWLFTGAGNNGKGVLTKTIAWVMGDYAIFPPPSLYMQTKYGEEAASRPRSELLDLQGVRFTPMSEPPGGKFADEVLKAHTGDDPIRARNLNSSLYIEFRPTHTIIFSTNKPPAIEDVGKSMQRRVRVIPFTEDFSGERADLNLEAKLHEEADGIFRLLVEAAVTWYEQGLEEPLSILEASRQYIEDNDPISEFCWARCVVDITNPDLQESSGVLYNAYCDWCRDSGTEKMSQTAFSIAMKQRFRSQRTRHGVVFRGLRTKSAVELV